MTLTAKAGERRVTASAVSPKPHSYRWLHEETVLRARAWPTSSKTGGDQNALNLRSATWSNQAENQLTSRTVPGYLHLEMVAAAASDDEAGVDRRALADEGLKTRVEAAGGRARAPHEIGQTPEEMLRVSSPPAGRVGGEDGLRCVSFGRIDPLSFD